jgi:hypothetical protein
MPNKMHVKLKSSGKLVKKTPSQLQQIWLDVVLISNSGKVSLKLAVSRYSVQKNMKPVVSTISSVVDLDVSEILD